MAKVSVRVAVTADRDGYWYAYGCSGEASADMMSAACDMVGSGEARYWLTAELDVPEEVEVTPSAVELLKEAAVADLRVPAQPGTDFAEMILVENHGQLTIKREKRSNRGYVRPDGMVVLSKHQQIALRDWLCKRWGDPGRG